MKLDLDALRAAFGLGVAGNFAGHLEQAGEAADFVAVHPVSAEAPKGIFPWYAPGAAGFLRTFPLSHDRIVKPEAASAEPVNLQIEPEVGVLCDVTYDDAGTVVALAPVAFGAFNDCSIRRPGAKKISHKKNWGPASKGVASQFVEASDLSADGPTATWRLACFLRRDGVVSAYGVDSPLPGYSYYGEQLLDWIVGRLRDQGGSDSTPLEDVGGLLRESGRPARALVGIGATRYTAVGESTFLEVGDESLVVVYDSQATSPSEVEEIVGAGDEDELSGASVLRQVVVTG